MIRHCVAHLWPQWRKWFLFQSEAATMLVEYRQALTLPCRLLGKAIELKPLGPMGLKCIRRKIAKPWIN